MSFRTKLALLFTVIYICGFALLAAIRFDELICLDLNELGDFLAGAFGPVALAWLVFGYFQQGDELRQGTEALRMQAEELNASVQQQVYMVEAQKAALDNHERSLEPIIYLESRGWVNDLDGDYDRFALLNKGQFCDKIVLSYVRRTGETCDLDLEPLHKDGERAFMLESDFSYRTLFSVRYMKASGKSGLQEFEVFRDFDQEDGSFRICKLPAEQSSAF